MQEDVAPQLLTMESMSQTYLWQDVDDPSLFNRACVAVDEVAMSAQGVQNCDWYRAQWSLTTNEWVTQELTVRATGDGWSRSLVLRRDDSGSWTANTSQNGVPPRALASPGIADGVDLAGALDCDLSRCPLTNTMPIRRLGLLERHVPRTPLVMAWVDMPSLQVIASDQYYASHNATTVSYASGTRNVNVLLSVDTDGVVLDYPNLARRLDASRAPGTQDT